MLEVVFQADSLLLKSIAKRDFFQYSSPSELGSLQRNVESGPYKEEFLVARTLSIIRAFMEAERYGSYGKDGLFAGRTNLEGGYCIQLFEVGFKESKTAG